MRAICHGSVPVDKPWHYGNEMRICEHCGLTGHRHHHVTAHCPDTSEGYWPLDKWLETTFKREDSV